MPGQVKATTKEKDTGGARSFVATHKGDGGQLLILICLMIVLWFFLILLSLISFTTGAQADLGAGLIIGFGLLVAFLLISGILTYDSRTYFIVDIKGLLVKDTYTWGITGRSLTIKREEMLRIYSNVRAEFPYFFVVYMRDGKKRYKGLDKSGLKEYDSLLYALKEMAPVIDEGTWRYKNVKDAEEKQVNS